MKKPLCISLSALLILTAFSACKPQNQSAVKITPEPEVSAVSEVTKAPEPTTEPTEVPTADPTEAPTNTPESKMEKLDIPVYSDEKLFFTPRRGTKLGSDFSSLFSFSAINNALDDILEELPTKAFRKAGSGEEYIIYESDSGYREYIFINREWYDDITITKGYNIVVGELLPYGSFTGLKKGDPIEKVESIDPVASLHKRYWLEVAGYVPESAAKAAKGGNPLSSIHYLEDGLLKIEYEMLADRSLVISNIVYSEEYTLTSSFPIYNTYGTEIEGVYSETINYRIEPIDLPKK